MQLLLRLILTFATLLMPLGMSAAPANVPQRAAMSDMPMGHCPDQTPRHDGKGSPAECTMACAASLPASDRAIHKPLLIVCEPVLTRAVQRLNGLHPETETPPPRHS